MARTATAFTERQYGHGFTETVTETDTDERKRKAGNQALLIPFIFGRSLVASVKPRIFSWSADHCLGDVLVKFASTLKSFVNYFQSYPALLVHVERCAEECPTFRTFLRRRERTSDTKMLTYERQHYVKFKLKKCWSTSDTLQTI